jgi:hypothetical protein
MQPRTMFLRPPSRSSRPRRLDISSDADGRCTERRWVSVGHEAVVRVSPHARPECDARPASLGPGGTMEDIDKVTGENRALRLANQSGKTLRPPHSGSGHRLEGAPGIASKITVPSSRVRS